MNDSDASGSDTSDVDEYATIAQRQSKIEKRRRREAERNERWDDEVDHLTMSVRLWSLVSLDGIPRLVLCRSGGNRSRGLAARSHAICDQEWTRADDRYLSSSLKDFSSVSRPLTG